jgi:outer membrane protein OmpA-like peptidoglycan-associated protein
MTIKKDGGDNGMVDFRSKLTGVPLVLFVSVVAIGLAGCATEKPAPAPTPPVAIVSTYEIATANRDDVGASLLRDGRVVLRGIVFATDSADLSGGSYAAAGNIAGVLNKNPQLKLAVVGHTDNTGDYTHNIELSGRRAQAIVDAIVNDYDVEPTRLAAVGVGPLAPINTNRTEYGRSQNRRVELVLIE